MQSKMALVLLLEHASSIFSILHIPSLFGKKDVAHPSLLSGPQTHHHCHWIYDTARLFLSRYCSI